MISAKCEPYLLVGAVCAGLCQQLFPPELIPEKLLQLLQAAAVAAMQLQKTAATW